MGIRIEYSILAGDDATDQWREIAHGTSGTQRSAEDALAVITTEMRNSEAVHQMTRKHFARS
jgi:hypothetical protein